MTSTNRNVFALLALAFALLALGPAAGNAAASQVQPVSVQACPEMPGGGCSYKDTVRVDQPFGLRVAFKVANAVSSGNSIFVEGPPGTEFRTPPDADLGYKLSSYTTFGVSVSNDGRRLQVPVPPAAGTITGDSTVELQIGFFADKVIVPATPGAFTVDVWTSADVDPRTSDNSIATTLGEPSALTAVASPLSAVAGEPLGVVPQALLSDSRGNPLPGEDVSFVLPASGPGGTFEGGGSGWIAATDAEGIASPSQPIDINGEAGEWQIALAGPASTSGAIDVTTAPADPDEVEVELDTDSVPADGATTATATIRVFDEFGNEVTDGPVSLDTGGGPTASPLQLGSDGSFTSTLTATTTPGEFPITAEATGVEPAVTDSAWFTQTFLPASQLDVALQPASIPADGSSTTTVTATVEDELGVGIDGETVEFGSSGDNEIGPTVDNGDGTYSAEVRSTTNPGTVTITATVTSVDPNLAAEASLTQSELPPPPDLPRPPATGDPTPNAPAGDPPSAPAVAPTVRIGAGPGGATRARKARFTFTAAGASRFECRLDGGRWSPCRSPKAFAVKPGRHVFRVRAIAPDGAAGPIATRAFKRLPPAPSAPAGRR
jgi:Invasin, domain 3